MGYFGPQTFTSQLMNVGGLKRPVKLYLSAEVTICYTKLSNFQIQNIVVATCLYGHHPLQCPPLLHTPPTNAYSLTSVCSPRSQNGQTVMVAFLATVVTRAVCGC